VNRWLAYTALVVACLASVGCARPQAQSLAADLLRLTQSYEVDRAGKAAAETAYYRKQLQILRGALGGSNVVAQSATIETGLPVEQSIAYGRIVTSASRDAYLAAEAIGAGASPGTAVLKYLDQGLADALEIYLQSHLRQHQLRTELLASLAKLDLQEARLDAVTEQLRVLKTPPKLEDTARDLFAIGRAIQKQLGEKGEAAR
jgi:hypothetical protein